MLSEVWGKQICSCKKTNTVATSIRSLTQTVQLHQTADELHICRTEETSTIQVHRVGMSGISYLWAPSLETPVGFRLTSAFLLLKLPDFGCCLPRLGIATPEVFPSALEAPLTTVVAISESRFPSSTHDRDRAAVRLCVAELHKRSDYYIRSSLWHS